MLLSFIKILSNQRFSIYTLCVIAFMLFGISHQAHAQERKSIAALFEKADGFIESGNLAQAEVLLNEALALSLAGQNKEAEVKLLTRLIALKIEQNSATNLDTLYDRALAITTELKDEMLQANVYSTKARQLMYNQKFNEAKHFYTLAGKVYLLFKNELIAAYYYNDLGYLEEAMGNHEKAAAWYLKAIPIFEQTGDKSGLANTLGNLGNTYFHLKDYAKAIELAHQSVALRKVTGDKEGIAMVLGNLTNVFLELKQLDSARMYQDEFIRYAKQSGKKKTLVESYANLAMMQYARKRYEPALTAIKNAIAVGKEINYPQLPVYYTQAARIFGAYSNESDMQSYYDTAFALMNKANNTTQLAEYFATRADYFSAIGDYKNAYENYLKHIQYKDATINEDVKKTVAQLEVQFESQKKNAQLQTEKATKARQAMYYNIVLSLLIVGLVIALFFFNRYKYRKQLEQKNLLLAERNRISAELHDEVGSSLSAINLMSHAALQQKDEEKLKQQLGKINSNTRHTMESISDIVWSMHPDNEHMPRVLSRMNEFAATTLEAAGIDYSFSFDDSIPKIVLSPQKRRDLYLIFKESINNIAKYSNATKASIRFDKTKEMLMMRIEDNGCGFDAGKSNAGNGLRNMHQRAIRNAGTCKIDSILAKGTTIDIGIPYA